MPHKSLESINRRVVPPLAIIFLLLGSFLAISSSEEVQSEHRIPASNQVIPFLLSSDSPAKLTLQFNDLDFETVREGSILTTSNVPNAGAITVTRTKSSLVFSFGNLASTEAALDSVPDCNTVLEYASSKIIFGCVGLNPIIELQYPNSSGVPILTHIYSPYADSIIITKKWSNANSLIRESVIRSMFLFFILLAFLNLIIYSSRLQVAAKRLIKDKRVFNLTTYSTSFLIFYTSAIAWPEDDDGNVLQTMRWAGDLKGLHESVSSALSWPIGNFPYRFFSPFTNVVDNLFVLRLPGTLLLVIGYLVLVFLVQNVAQDKSPKKKGGGQTPIQLINYALSTFYLLGTFAFGITLRGEVWVNFFNICLMSIFFSKISTDLKINLTIFLSATSLIAHQSGVTSIVLGMVILFKLMNKINLANFLKSNWKNLAISYGLVTLNVFYEFNLFQLFGAFSEFSNRHQSQNLNPLLEYQRYVQGLSQNPIRSIFVLSIILLVLSILYLMAQNEARFPRDLIDLTSFSLVGIAGLIFTASKWMWHFGSVIGFVATLSAIIVFLYSSFIPSRRMSMSFSLIFFLFFLYIGLKNGGGPFFGTLPPISDTNSGLFYQISNFNFRNQSDLSYFLLFLFLFSTILYLFVAKFPKKSSVFFFTFFPVYFLASNFIAFTPDYLSDQNFSVASSNRIDNLASECGAVKHLSLSLPTKVSEVSNQLQLSSGMVIGDSYTSIDNLRIPFQTVEFLDGNLELTFSGVDQFSDSLMHYGFFVKPSDNASATISTASSVSSFDLEAKVWNLIVPPSDSNELKVSFSSPDSTISLRVSSPLVFNRILDSELLSLLQEGSVVVDPQFLSMVSCLRTPTPVQGYYPHSDWAMVNLRYTDLGQSELLDVGSKYFYESDVWALGCIANRDRSNENWYQGALCIYRLTNGQTVR
jgi:hypothetical protein